MRRAWFVLCTLVVVGLFFGCAEDNAPQSGFVVSGKIKGADGQEPAMAHVHLTELTGSFRKPLQSEPLSADGQFSLKIDEPGVYRLWVTATDHRMAEIPLVLQPDSRTVQVDVSLKMLDFKDSFDEVKILGSWNDYAWREAAAMQRQPDGTYTYEVEAASDTVGYQLLGILERSRSVNGTHADLYEYDGGGDYRSLILTDGQDLSIVFDPGKLPEPLGENELTVTFDRDHAFLAEMLEVERRVEQAFTDYNEARRAYKDEHGSARGFTYSFSQITDYLDEKMTAAENHWVRQAAAMLYTRLHYFDADLGAETYAKIIETAPSESPLWHIGLFALVEGYAFLEHEKTEAHLQKVYAENSEPKVQASALASLAWLAQLEGHKAEYQSRFAELKEKYADDSLVPQYILAQLDPDSPIAWGKPVPDFEVELLDGSKTVSDENMQGQFYLIDFWATWCAPCVREMPKLHAAYEKFKDTGFTILSLSLDSKPEDIAEFREESWEMPWLHSFIDDGWKSELVSDFSVNQTGIPSPFLISPEGKIVATHDALRGDYLERTLTKYLGTN